MLRDKYLTGIDSKLHCMRVLFICTGNSFRSPVAEALARKYKPDFEVESAGVSPADKIAGNGRRFLEEEGCLEYVKPSPDPVTERALEEADKIVVMSDEHKEYLLNEFQVSEQKIENWDVSDPINFGVDPREAFEEIKRKVKNL